VRCPRCGNENQNGMRFCGMCGGTLLPSPPPSASHPERAASAPAVSATATATRPPAPEAPRTPPRITEDSPSISGPSFLGLGDAAPPARKQGNLSIDPHSHSGSRNLDYLLHDDEEHRGGGAGKFFLILLALALAVGFGYLRFKNQLPWLNTGESKPSPAAQTSDQPASDSSTPSTPGNTPESQPAPTNQPAPSQPANPPAETASHPAPDSAATHPDAAANPPSDSASNADTAKTPPPGDAPTAGKPSEPAAKTEDTGDDKESSAPPREKTSKPKAAAPAALPKPRAASKPVDSVAEAQRYLYGRGAAQDCEHGLRILKPLANQGDPKAMMEMGALYSAGLCTPHDLPTAYRWFAIALRKDPSNQAIQTDLQKLWGEMTQPERQLAIKLTQ